MELSQEDKDRIEAEERERAAVRQRLAVEQDGKRPKVKDLPWWLKPIGAKGFLLIGAIVLAPLLFVHIVYTGFVPVAIFAKDQPGFGDTFVNYESLTGIPKIVLLAQHSSVVKGLEKRGMVKWESLADKEIPAPLPPPAAPTETQAPVSVETENDMVGDAPGSNSSQHIHEKEFKPKTKDERDVVAAAKLPSGTHASRQKVVSVQITEDWALVGEIDRNEQTDGGSIVCHKQNGKWKEVAEGSAIIEDLKDAGVHVPQRIIDAWYPGE